MVRTMYLPSELGEDRVLQWPDWARQTLGRAAAIRERSGMTGASWLPLLAMLALASCDTTHPTLTRIDARADKDANAEIVDAPTPDVAPLADRDVGIQVDLVRVPDLELLHDAGGDAHLSDANPVDSKAAVDGSAIVFEGFLYRAGGGCVAGATARVSSNYWLMALCEWTTGMNSLWWFTW